MAFVFNPLSGQFDQTNIDASALTTGTLSDARLSSNVPLLGSSNTFSQNQTFSGTANTAPNQTAASGSSLMTRSLVDSRIYAPTQLRGIAFSAYSQTSFATALSGNARAFNSGYEAIASTTSGSYGVTRLTGAAATLSNLWSSVDWSSAYVFGARISFRDSLDANSTQRIIWGTNSYTTGNPTNRCVGFKIINGNIWGFCHNGTTYTESASSNAISTKRTSIGNYCFFDVYVQTNGLGRCEWFVDGVSLGVSASGGPSASSASFQNEIAIASEATATASNTTSIGGTAFWIQKP